MDREKRALEVQRLATQLTAAMFEETAVGQDRGSIANVQGRDRLEQRGTGISIIAAVFVSATFLGSFLLFSIEPIVAKLVLPLVGGSPAIWTTAVLFFQLVLLASYAYVHALRRLPLWTGFAIHMALLLACGFFLPFSVSAGGSDVVNAPVFAILLMLLRSVGLPFFVLAATSPLLQLWVTKTATRAAANPYPLYAAGNLGSLTSLLIYPFAIEPFTGLRVQSFGWTIAFVAFAFGIVSAYGVTIRFRSDEDRSVARIGTVAGLSFGKRIRWVLLAFVPSSVMLGMTASLSTTIAPMPLLWTLPLALYLLTFVIAFSRGTRSLRYGILRATPFAIPLVLLLIAMRAVIAIPAYVELQLAVVFLISLACHGALADDAPPVASLTEFYVWIAVGGALGGVFNAIVAPAIFPTVLEYPIAIIAGCGIGTIFEKYPRTGFADFALPAGLCIALLASLAIFGTSTVLPATRIALALGAVACFAFSRHRLRFALGAAALVIAGSITIPAEGRSLSIDRNFFGVKTIFVDPEHHLRLFVHSATLHGVQNTDPDTSREPLSYYARLGPLGDAMSTIRAERAGVPIRAVVAGLGIGSVACYARSGDRWTFLEIDPAVVRLARSPFTFLSQCTPDAPVILGDARLSLETLKTPSDVIILDAYTSDSPPLHLLSREAVSLYNNRMTSHGYLLFNISNKFFNLAPVLAADAASAGLKCKVARYDPSQADIARGVFPSDWVVLTHDGDGLARFDRNRWLPCATKPGLPLWTDDYSSLLRLWLPN